MLSLRTARRFCHAAAASVSTIDTSAALSSKILDKRPLEEPALVKLKAERDPEKLFNLFKANAHNRLVVENRFAFVDTVARLAAARRFDYIEHLLEHQKTLPQGRREGFVMRIIMLYGKAKMTKNAVDTFYNMHLYGSKRTVKSFNATLKVLAEAHDLGAIEEFFGDVPLNCSVEPDIISMNTVIKAFCDAGIVDKAYSIMVKMEKRGMVSDVVTYTTLIAAFYKNNRWEVGNGLWNLMVHKGCMPNLATFNARIQYLVNRRRAWDANDLMHLMQIFSIVPDEITYNLVIKGFCLAGYLEMAKRVYSALLGKRFKPNVKICQTMIHYLCKGGEYDLAFTMCVDCMKKNWFLNMDTMLALLEGLKRSGNVLKAREIVSLAQKRVPPFSPSQLNSLLSILSTNTNTGTQEID